MSDAATTLLQAITGQRWERAPIYVVRLLWPRGFYVAESGATCMQREAQRYTSRAKAAADAQQHHGRVVRLKRRKQ